MTVKAYTAMLGDVKEAASAGQKLWVDPSKARPAHAASLHVYTHLNREAVILLCWAQADWVDPSRGGKLK